MDNQNTAPVLRSTDSKANGQSITDINQEFKERDIRGKARKTGLKYIDLRSAPLNQNALQMTSWEQVQRLQTVPFNVSGKVMQLASIDPKSAECQEAIDFFQSKGYEIDIYICSTEGIESTKAYFDRFKHQDKVEVETKIAENEQSKDWQKEFEEHKEVFEKSTGPEMVNTMNLLTIKFKASDIHFQPEEENVLLRLRRDGQLYDALRISHKQFLLLSGEIKRSAGLKINIKNIPQDGDYEFIANERKIGVRVSTLPSKYGESIVLRILDSQKAFVDLNKLGYSEHAKKIIVNKLNRDRGLILVTGPTGSGKTSTLYSGLHLINTPDIKIITLEDPVEYELKNIVQSEINEEDDFTFASGLRSILRQDPDVIMVGEIRDRDAAEIALQASLTGHLVISTVHANDSIATVPRLLNMGVKSFILAAGLELIIAQRLVRKICDKCKKATELSEAELHEIEATIESLNKKGIKVEKKEFYTSEGCDECAKTGFHGRIAVSEVLPITNNIRKSILEEKNAQEILAIAEAEGFVSMGEDGILKVVEGVSTLEEVRKILV